jgi:hypothetical protein
VRLRQCKQGNHCEPSARAFSQENGGSAGSENSTFADPDEQINVFGQGAGAQPLGSNGSVQFDA